MKRIIFALLLFSLTACSLAEQPVIMPQVRQVAATQLAAASPVPTQAPTLTATTQPTPTLAQSTQAQPTEALTRAPEPTVTDAPIVTQGYLWWPNDFTPLRPGEKRSNVPLVYVLSGQHQSIPIEKYIADLWASLGEACYAEAGAIYEPAETKHPSWGVGIRVLSGNCAGFVGWVTNRAALHSLPPGVYEPMPAGSSG